MKINGSYLFPAPADEVWDLLLDPQVLLRVIPGLQKVEMQGDDILATATIGVGPVKGTFSGKLTLLDKQPPTHVRVVGEGKGGPGFLKGECILDAVEADGKTTINYQADVQIGGTLATVGQRLVDATTQSIMQQGFAAFNRVLAERQAAAAETARLAALQAEERQAEQTARTASETLGVFPPWFILGLLTVISVAVAAIVVARGTK